MAKAVLPLRRVLATCVDYTLIALPLIVTGTVLPLVRRRPNGFEVSPGHMRWAVAFGLTLPAAAALAWGETRGATPGKRLWGLHVEDSDGQPPGYGQAFLRVFAKTALPWELGHQAVWDLRDEKQGRGAALATLAYTAVLAQIVGAACGSGLTYADLLAGTQVQRSPDRPIIGDTRRRTGRDGAA